MGRSSHVLVAAAAVCLLGVLARSAFARDLTFEDRVRAQEAVERIAYAHQIGAVLPFTTAVPRPVIEKKVETALKQCVALETFWHTPVTAFMLRSEMDRITRGSRMPERLRQIGAALGGDAFLVQEVLARSTLAGRLTHHFYAFDPDIHRATRVRAELLRRGLLRGEIDPRLPHPDRRVLQLTSTGLDLESAPSPARRRGVALDISGAVPVWRLDAADYAAKRAGYPQRAGEIGELIETPDAFRIPIVLEDGGDRVRVAVYSYPKTGYDEWWSAVAGRLRIASVTAVADEGPLPLSGARRKGETTTDPWTAFSRPEAALTCLPDDTWDNGILDDVPYPTELHAAVWTGTRMIVWGGFDYTPLQRGVLYDPATDTWTPTSTTGAPEARTLPAAVWTGTKMIVWGGQDGTVSLNTGGRYDPATDTWAPTSTSGAPSARTNPGAVWTGTRMVIWGGDAFATGGRYDPSTDTWASVQTSGAPAARGNHTTIWTGSVMIVWGGSNGSTRFATGGRYDPVGNTWLATSSVGAPAARAFHAGVWTGSRMLVWGGSNGSVHLASGGSYDPVTNTWSAMTASGAPTARSGHSAVWTGGRMIVWGGYDDDFVRNTGALYDPALDTWTPTSISGAPSRRYLHTAVWTGDRMIVWGGWNHSIYTNTGGRYDPLSDTWTPTATTGLGIRGSHTAIWTGNRLIVWGGFSGVDLPPGLSYDPVTDTIDPVSTANEPSFRGIHTAVWTGSRMIVWGGYGANGDLLDTGGRYDPISDSWSPITLVGAPGARNEHVAAWTGRHMVVWGGSDADGDLASGGRYDPTRDVWSSTSLANAPGPRHDHTAVWTGSRMIVWGGATNFGGTLLGDGGEYDSDADVWTPTAAAGAPSPRTLHSAIWTGTQMIVWGGVDAGSQLQTGARYDPISRIWTSMATAGAPAARFYHTAVWTGRRMIVWGGVGSGSTTLGNGALYDPATDAWQPTSMNGAPRFRYGHTATWCGSWMIVCGGAPNAPSAGGRYAFGQSTDDDGDGYSECGGDCDDGRATVHPAAAETCDGLDDDCNGAVDDGAGPPGPARGLAPLSGGNGFGWEPQPGAESYDIVVGSLDVLAVTHGAFVSAITGCLENDGTNLEVQDPTVPGSGHGVFYLLRAIGCGSQAGTYDTGAVSQIGSRDPGITSSDASCP